VPTAAATARGDALSQPITSPSFIRSTCVKILEPHELLTTRARRSTPNEVWVRTRHSLDGNVPITPTLDAVGQHAADPIGIPDRVAFHRAKHTEGFGAAGRLFLPHTIAFYAIALAPGRLTPHDRRQVPDRPRALDS
jgi:hypothetical protein